MIVPADDAAAMEHCATFAPDVVVLDLEYAVQPKYKEAARAGLGKWIPKLAERQIEVFVRIDRETRWADAKAAVVRGIRGIVFPGPEDAGEVSELGELVASSERERGVESGTIELALMLESAQGFWNIERIAQADPRVRVLGVGRIDLSMQLGPLPQNEFRLFRLLMTRTLIAARMLDKQPLGAHWRPGSRGGVASAEHTAKAANEARLMGFTGCVCATPEQVAPVNAGYSPA